MDWVIGAVIIAIVIFVGVTLDTWIRSRPRPLTPQERDAEIIALKGMIEALKKENKVLEDRGDRHVNARDAAEKRLERMHETFADLIKKTGESALLKQFVQDVAKSRNQAGTEHE